MKYIAADKVVPLCRLLMFGVPQKTADAMCEDIQTLVDLQAADVSPVVHGGWQLLDECSNAGIYCSVCHKAVFRENAWYKNVHIKSKYCPNCGAKMDGKNEKL